MTITSESKLTKSQKKTFSAEDSDGNVYIARVRFDDECGNGHNTFSVTCDVYDRDRANGDASVTNKSGKRRWLGSCGCCHDDVRKRFPKLAPLIKWHLTSTDGPMHYIANTRYHAGWRDGMLFLEQHANLDAARSCAVAPDATREQLVSEEWLKARLPALLAEFRKDVESLGFTW